MYYDLQTKLFSLSTFNWLWIKKRGGGGLAFCVFHERSSLYGSRVSFRLIDNLHETKNKWLNNIYPGEPWHCYDGTDWSVSKGSCYDYKLHRPKGLLNEYKHRCYLSTLTVLELWCKKQSFIWNTNLSLHFMLDLSFGLFCYWRSKCHRICIKLDY